MKKTIAILILSLFATQAQASFWDVVGAVAGAIAESNNSSNSSGSGYSDSRHGSRQGSRISCSYTDDGHEEHSRGHRDCNDCMSKHGKCKETCSASYAVCKVEGRDYRGYAMTVEGKGDSQYEAEREALRRCDRNNYSDCRRVSCNSESETVSRRTCRR